MSKLRMALLGLPRRHQCVQNLRIKRGPSSFVRLSNTLNFIRIQNGPVLL